MVVVDAKVVVVLVVLVASGAAVVAVPASPLLPQAAATNARASTRPVIDRSPGGEFLIIIALLMVETPDAVVWVPRNPSTDDFGHPHQGRHRIANLSLQRYLCNMSQPRIAVVQGPQRLKALAHPLRMRLLGLLRLEGPGTASSFARRLNETSGATSYHLRQLARHGFIEVDESLGIGREKWWKAAHEITQWSMADFLDDPAAAVIADTMRRQLLGLQASLLNAYFAKEPEWGRDWVDAAALDDHWIHLNPPGLQALISAIHALIDEHDLGPDAGPGTERVAVLLQAFPTEGLPI